MSITSVSAGTDGVASMEISEPAGMLVFFGWLKLTFLLGFCVALSVILVHLPYQLGLMTSAHMCSYYKPYLYFTCRSSHRQSPGEGSDTVSMNESVVFIHLGLNPNVQLDMRQHLNSCDMDCCILAHISISLILSSC